MHINGILKLSYRSKWYDALIQKVNCELYCLKSKKGNLDAGNRETKELFKASRVLLPPLKLELPR